MLRYLLDTNIVIYVLKRRPIEVLSVFNQNASRMGLGDQVFHVVLAPGAVVDLGDHRHGDGVVGHLVTERIGVQRVVGIGAGVRKPDRDAVVEGLGHAQLPVGIACIRHFTEGEITDVGIETPSIA